MPGPRSRSRRSKTVTLLPRWGALLSGTFVLKAIKVEHPQIHLELDEAGRWPFLSRIHPPKATGGPMPRVDVVGGEIQISNIGPEKRIPDMKFTGIEGNLRAWSVNTGAWWSDINVPDSILGKMHVEIHNSGLNDQVQGRVQLLGVKLGPEIRDLLPSPTVSTWDSFAPGGTMDVGANLAWDPAKDPPLQVEGDAQLHDVEREASDAARLGAGGADEHSRARGFQPEGNQRPGRHGQVRRSAFRHHVGSRLARKGRAFRTGRQCVRVQGRGRLQGDGAAGRP